MSFQKRFTAGKIILMCASFVFAVTAASAQTSRIVLPDRQVTLFELFDEIKQQAGYTVVFNAGKNPPAQTVTLTAREGTTSELLTQALPGDKYAWRTVDNFIVVRTLPEALTTAALPPQPTREEFESDVREYTQRNIQLAEGKTGVHYDTIRTVKPHSGIFDYPAREFVPGYTTRAARTPFERTTPPMFAVKTNLLWWADRGTVNIGGEIGLGKHTSLELSGGINRWNLEGSAENNKKMVHWVIKPEFRYWLCERFSGHFFGVHALYGKYNVGGYDVPLLFEKEFRYEGYAYGGGINYGYHWAWSKRWGMEFTIGAGVLMMDYVKKDCEKCGREVGNYKKTYFGPTELGVKLIFMIK